MNEDLAGKVLRFRWLIFLILALAYFFVYFHRLSLSVVADDLIKEFQTTASMMGLLGSVYFYCYAAMQFPAGLLSDSLGPRKSVTCFLIVAAVGSIVFGFAPTIKVAFIGRVLVGVGVSMVFIPTMKILSQWFRAHEFASMTGIFNAVGGIGVLAATWLLAIMAALLGWRLSFELIGACTFIIVVLAWLLIGIKAFLMVQLPITLLAGAIGMWLFYVQHQFEDTYWKYHEEWDFHRAGIEGSSYYDLPAILHWFTGNIGFHHIHHLASRVPNYNLQRCYKDLPQLHKVTRLSMLESAKCAHLQLWHEELGKLISIRQLELATADGPQGT